MRATVRGPRKTRTSAPRSLFTPARLRRDSLLVLPKWKYTEAEPLAGLRSVWFARTLHLTTSHNTCSAITHKGVNCSISADRFRAGKWLCHIHDPHGVFRRQVRGELPKKGLRKCRTEPLMNSSSLWTMQDTLTRLRKQRLDIQGSTPPGRTAKLSSQIAEEASTSGGPDSSSSCPPSRSTPTARPSPSSCSGSATGTSASTAKSSSTPSTASDTGSTCSSKALTREQYSGSSDLLGLQGPGDQPCARQSLDTALHCPMTPQTAQGGSLRSAQAQASLLLFIPPSPEQAKVVKRRIIAFGKWMDEEEKS